MNEIAIQERRDLLRSLRRWLLAGLGVVCVGLGLVGMVVPGLPTTIFLIIASALFTKSCPVLEGWLIRNRVFAPYLRYLDGTASMPMRARITTIAAMWTSILVSLAWLLLAERLTPASGSLIVAAGAMGTWFIASRGRPRAGSCRSDWRRSPRSDDDARSCPRS